MKKKPKKLTIDATLNPASVAFRALNNLTRGELVTELKVRKVPVPKLKADMRMRLAEHILKAGLPVTVTIG